MTRALTLHQPWASLIAVGAKSIETRSWRTKYRGPLVIHAGKTPPPERCDNEWPNALWVACEEAGLCDREGVAAGWFSDPPLGAMVASCVLADCVPIIDRFDPPPEHGCYVEASERGLRLMGGDPVLVDIIAQDPFGDFTPGRFAWLLEDVKPTSERCPACWGDGLGGSPYAVGDDFAPCPACNGARVCGPVPAKGKQGLWEWTP